MHWIQKHILDQLIYHPTRRFSELRADGVESNLFQYHLRHIIKKGLVEKTDGGYQLAPVGLYYADRYSLVYKGERPQPKLITVVVIKNSAGETLLLKKKRQPWVGQLHLTAGKIHAGEAASEAARREVQEKLEVAIDSVEFRSVAQVQIRKEGVAVSDFVAFVFSAKYDGTTAEGEWYSLDIENNSDLASSLAPSVKELLQIERCGDGSFHVVEIDL